MKQGCLIALFGTDGSGKSTVANLLEERFRILEFKSSRYHWRPRLLPSLVTDIRKIDVSRPDDNVPRSFSTSLVTYLYFFFDFFLAYFLIFLPFIKSGGIILHERYFYDILFHPKRYRALEIKKLADMLGWMTPRPDLIVHLHGEPETIQNRKPELSLSEIYRQQVMMKQKLQDYGPLLSLDVTKTEPKIIAEKIIAAISDMKR